MSIAAPVASFGELLREWRARRRLSQLELALDARVSQRHLSYLETGRAAPSRTLVLRLAAELQLGPRDGNELLLAAGFAPVFSETPLASETMLPVRHALQKILTGHEPFPAIVVDRGWDIVASNAPARELMAAQVAAELLEPPVNAMRIVLHPRGLAPRIDDLAGYGAHLVARLARQLALRPDPVVAALHEELVGYLGGPAAVLPEAPAQDGLFRALCLRDERGRELRFFSTLSTFGTAIDVTLAELCVEAFFPADKATSRALQERFG